MKHRKIIMGSSIRLVLYSKPGCHLCEGLQEKLEDITAFSIDLEIRDIRTREEWLQRFQYEIPVLFYVPEAHHPSIASDGLSSMEQMNDTNTIEEPHFIRVERASPRAPVSQVEKLIGRAIAQSKLN